MSHAESESLVGPVTDFYHIRCVVVLSCHLNLENKIAN